jgi:dCMP deaminase
MNKWDRYFLILAKHIADQSKDPSTKCGAVIARPDKSIASTGFNGFPKGTKDDDSLYENRELKYERVVHAEMNAIVLSREDINGYSIYTWPPSSSGTCARCAAHIIQAGITKLTYIDDDSSGFAGRWGESAKIAHELYEEAGVEVNSIPIWEWTNK